MDLLAVILREGHPAPQPQVHRLAATILNSLGKSQQAAVAAETAIKEATGGADTGLGAAAVDEVVSFAFRELANAQSNGATPAPAQLIERMKRSLEAPELHPRARRTTLLILAELLETVGEPLAAFEHVRQAQALAVKRHDVRREFAYVRYLAGLFQPLGRRCGADKVELDAKNAMRGAGGALPERLSHSSRAPRPRLIFVVGLPRSGTTLLDRMLSAHPDILSIDESVGMRDVNEVLLHAVALAAGKRPDGLTAEDLTAHLDDAMLCRAARAYYEIIGPRLQGKTPRFVVDKMPSNGYLAPLIALVFPDARFLLLRRHPLDVALSWFKRDFCHFSDLRNFASVYRAFAALMDCWRRILAERLCVVKYEQLVAEPAAEIRRALEHCGLEYDLICAAPPSQGGMVKTASIAQARRAIDTRSVGKWRQVEKEMAPLVDALGGMGWIRDDDAKHRYTVERKAPERPDPEKPEAGYADAAWLFAIIAVIGYMAWHALQRRVLEPETLPTAT